MRKKTVFRLCRNHQHWAGGGRYRLAEMFCEGGPGFGKPCADDGPCRVRPGSDLFGSTATDAVADDWVENWAVNTPCNVASYDID